MTHEPFDDLDAKREAWQTQRNREIDRAYEQKRRVDEMELISRRTGPKARSVSPSLPSAGEQRGRFRRYPFERADLDRVAKELETLAIAHPERATSFAVHKEFALELVDRHLPPSPEKERIYREVADLWHAAPVSNRETLERLTREVRRSAGSTHPKR